MFSDARGRPPRAAWPCCGRAVLQAGCIDRLASRRGPRRQRPYRGRGWAVDPAPSPAWRALSPRSDTYQVLLGCGGTAQCRLCYRFRPSLVQVEARLCTRTSTEFRHSMVSRNRVALQIKTKRSIVGCYAGCARSLAPAAHWPVLAHHGVLYRSGILRPAHVLSTQLCL